MRVFTKQLQNILRKILIAQLPLQNSSKEKLCFLTSLNTVDLISLSSQSKFFIHVDISSVGKYRCYEASSLCITKEFLSPHLVLKHEQKLEVCVSEDKLQREDRQCSPRLYVPFAIRVPFQITPW